jgi:hypothetical protein
MKTKVVKKAVKKKTTKRPPINLKKKEACIIFNEKGELKLVIPIYKGEEVIDLPTYLACGIAMMFYGDKKEELMNMIDELYEENMKKE